jgi:ketopantoate hydroxymethyltransferase
MFHLAFVICQSQQQGFKMVPRETQTDIRGNPMANVGSGTVLQNGANSFYLIAQGGLKGTSKPVKHIVVLNENESPVNGHTGLTLQNLMNLAYHSCFKYPTATKV